MKYRRKLCEELKSILGQNTVFAADNAGKIKEKFNVPVSISSDYLSLRTDVEYAEDYILFCILDVLSPEKTNEYFNEREIKEYLNTKYELKKIKFPLRLKCIQVDVDQWIGCITARQLMELKDAQLIRYNENTQRTMKRHIYGESEVYTIALNKGAVKSIMTAMDEDSFIPNTLTFNLPENAEYIYNDSKMELVIREMDYLDILDGYHRYIALSKLHHLNKFFDYKMELRIVQFPEAKAKQFIYQEDQKTKMSKDDSNSFNQSNIANRIVDRLNIDVDFNLNHQISRNKGIIKTSWLTEIIEKTYTKDVKKKDEAVAVVNIERELKEKLNKITEEDSNLLVEPWDRDFVIAAVYVSYYAKDDYTRRIACYVRKLYSIMTERNISSQKVSKPYLSKIDKVLREEVLEDR